MFYIICNFVLQFKKTSLKITFLVVTQNKATKIQNNSHRIGYSHSTSIKDKIEFHYNSKPDIHKVPYKIFNIGNNKPEDLNKYINAIEVSLNKTAKINLCPMQPGDIQKTHSDTSLIYEWIKFRPSTNINNGVKKFVSWYLNYHE